MSSSTSLRRLAVLVVLLAAFAAIAGCGSNGDDAAPEAGKSDAGAPDNADARSVTPVDTKAPTDPPSLDDSTSMGTESEKKKPKRPRTLAERGRRREQKAKPDEERDFSKMPYSRAVELVGSAGVAFEQKNYHKVVKRLETALKILEFHRDEDGAADVEKKAKRMHLFSRFRKNDDMDLAAEFRALTEAFPGGFDYADYRQVGVDLAFVEDWDDSLSVLGDGARVLPAKKERFEDYQRLVKDVRAAAKAYSGPAAKIDPNYRSFMERTRPDTPSELYEYAMRATTMKVWEKAILALHDARGRLADVPDPDAQLGFLIRYNESLAWAAIGAFDVAVREFDAMVADDGITVDWITTLQFGAKLAEAGGTDEARRVLEAGKAKFPSRVSHFDQELSGL